MRYSVVNPLWLRDFLSRRHLRPLYRDLYPTPIAKNYHINSLYAINKKNAVKSISNPSKKILLEKKTLNLPPKNTHLKFKDIHHHYTNNPTIIDMTDTVSASPIMNETKNMNVYETNPQIYKERIFNNSLKSSYDNDDNQGLYNANNSDGYDGGGDNADDILYIEQLVDSAEEAENNAEKAEDNVNYLV